MGPKCSRAGAAALCAAIAMLLFGAAPAAAQAQRFDVLVFSKTTGFRHADAIAAGKAQIAAMGTAGGFSVTASEDATLFSDAGLRSYEVVVFLQTDGEGILSPAQRTAFERWAQRGGGIVSIHADANADRDWAWKTDMMGGALFANHPAGALQLQTATVRIEDPDHPATRALPTAWVRQDEWYNFTAEPRGKVHVLATLDEATYEEQDGSPAADDHPIVWCSRYDGARHFYTALGHDGTAWQDPLYRSHISGAIEWASGAAAGNCGPEREGIPTDAAFDKVTLDDNTENPMEIAVADDGQVFYVELAGKVKRFDPRTNSVRVIGTIPVHRGNENGLLGIALDPAFTANRRLYLFYSAPAPEEQHVSRFTLAADGTLDMASEKVLLRIPHQRVICCHSAGSMTFGPQGDLYISTGDDTAHYASSGFNPIDDRFHGEVESANPDAQHSFDARRTSGNTNDLRGKILRITPQEDGTYAIPAGNLFPPFGSDPAKTRPEIFSMGHRNPFRISVDQETGWVYNGEVGPDASADNPNRGPRGYDELNQIRQASNMGWPYCIADNKAYNDFDFATNTSGPKFDCAGGPVNDSAWNTGLAKTPPAQSAFLWWPYGASPDFPGIPGGAGRTAIAGPVYHFDPANPSPTKLPEYYDDKVFFADWSRDWIATVALDAAGRPGPIEEFMPGTDFRHPQDIEMGADGSLYVLEWGRDFNYAGSGVNPDSGLYRIDYAKGTRTPVARASADKNSGPGPLTVTFSSEGSEDPDGDQLTYSWNFGDGSPAVQGAAPTHTFTQAGTFQVRLTATDATGKSGSSTVVIDVGNTRPSVTIDTPAHGGLFEWGDEIPFTVTVSDPDDAQIDCSRVTVTAGIFHDEGGNAHVHPGVGQQGCTGTIDAPAESGHEKSATIALVLTATYTDAGGQPGSNPLEGADTQRLNPKTIQAEHNTGAHPGTQRNARPAAEGGARVGFNDAGEWIHFDPVSLHRIDSVRVRYTSGGNGGQVQFRLDAPDGPLVGTVDLPNTGGWDTYAEVTAPLTPPDAAPHRLYLVYAALPGRPGTDLFDLDELRFAGRGIASNSAPTATARADVTSGVAPLAVAFTGTAADLDGDALTYAWDFESDGTVDARTKDAAHVYTQPGRRTARFTVSDGERTATAEITINASRPAASCAGDDEFSGTDLDARWTVVREDPARLSVEGGRLNIVSAKADIHAGDQGLPNIVLQDLPDSGPWTATTRVTWNPTQNYQNAGLVIYESDSAWIKTGMVWADRRGFEAFKELNNAPQLLGAANVAADFPTTFYIRFTSDGTSVQAQRSADGETWTNTGQATTLAGLNDPRIGVYATASTSASTGTPTAGFDFFRLSVPQTPSDEFTGTSLNTCRWSAIVRPDPAGYAVADGRLSLTAAHGDFFGAAPNDNPNVILQPAPPGPWTATTRMTFDPDEDFEQAGIIVYGDDANYVKADLVHAGGRKLEFLREKADVPAGFGATKDLAADFPTTVELRVTSDGTLLRAFYRPVGGQWEPFGEPAALADVPAPKVGIYANDGNRAVTSREQAVFDFFQLTAGASDTTAPQTAHTLSPAAPDGSGGWYRTPVSVTLASEPGARIEYRVGDGAFGAYAGAIALATDGTHVVGYRSTDAADNVEATRTVTVRVDRTAPTSTATATGDGPATVTVAGADAAGGSGVATLEYRLDGGTWTAYTGPVTVSAPGQHTIEHRATDVAGNTGTTGSRTFTVAVGSGAPTVEAFADPPAGPAPLAVRLTATGLDPDGGSLSYRWAFSDGGSALGATVSRTYATAGTFTATVTATDGEGRTATDAVTITVEGARNEAPELLQAIADRTSGGAPLEVWFEAVARDADGDRLTYRWEFGDGPGSSLGAETEHTYRQPGTFTARVTVTDPSGASDTATIAITVAEPPGNRAPTVQAGAVPASGRVPLDVLLTAEGSDPDGDAMTYAWDFGDGSPVAPGRRARHTYTRPGSYTARVTVTDERGATGTATVPVVVGNPPANQAPSVIMAADPAGGATAPMRVSFSAAGRDPDGDELSYVWDFGDGGRAGGPRASHTFAAAGSYTVTVTVRDASGASGTATMTVAVAAARAAAVVSLRAPTVSALSSRGLTAVVRCGGKGTARASLWLSRTAAERLGLASRRLASRSLRCGGPRGVAVRMQPSRGIRQRLARATGALRVEVRLAPDGGRPVKRSVTLRPRSR